MDLYEFKVRTGIFKLEAKEHMRWERTYAGKTAYGFKVKLWSCYNKYPKGMKKIYYLLNKQFASEEGISYSAIDYSRGKTPNISIVITWRNDGTGKKERQRKTKN